MTKKYTVDSIDNGMYVLVDHPNENKKLLISIDKYTGKLLEGDIVEIEEIDGEHWITNILEDETKEMKDKVSNLLEKLKDKN